MTLKCLQPKKQKQVCDYYTFEGNFTANNKLCVLIRNMGKLLEKHGFIDKRSVDVPGWGKSRTKSRAKSDFVTAYTVAALLEQEVMDNYFIYGCMHGSTVINANGDLFTFRLRELTEEYEGKFVAYYEYVVTEQDSEKGAEV